MEAQTTTTLGSAFRDRALVVRRGGPCAGRSEQASALVLDDYPKYRPHTWGQRDEQLAVLGKRRSWCGENTAARLGLGRAATPSLLPDTVPTRKAGCTPTSSEI